jgi:hypothetical protein
VLIPIGVMAALHRSEEASTPSCPEGRDSAAPVTWAFSIPAMNAATRFRCSMRKRLAPFLPNRRT